MLLIAATIGCGGLYFTAPRLDIDSLRLQFVEVPDTIQIGTEVLACVRVVNQDGVDVSAFIDNVTWRIQPTTVAGLTGGRSSTDLSRRVVGIAAGTARLSVSAEHRPEFERAPLVSDELTIAVVVASTLSDQQRSASVCS